VGHPQGRRGPPARRPARHPGLTSAFDRRLTSILPEVAAAWVILKGGEARLRTRTRTRTRTLFDQLVKRAEGRGGVQRLRAGLGDPGEGARRTRIHTRTRTHTPQGTARARRTTTWGLSSTMPAMAGQSSASTPAWRRPAGKHSRKSREGTRFAVPDSAGCLRQPRPHLTPAWRRAPEPSRAKPGRAPRSHEGLPTLSANRAGWPTHSS
jgi:hypothetical protein